MRNVLIRVPVVMGLFGVAFLAVAPGAHAAPPTRIVDRTAFVICTAVSEDVEITVQVGRSDLAGTESHVRLSYASNGEKIGGGDSTSEWGDGTFRAVIPVLDPQEQPAGEVIFGGSFKPTGEPQLTRDKFNAGNIHVVEEHSVTSLVVSDVVLTYQGITFTDPTCEGSLTEGSLFFTNPATVVQFGSYFYDNGTCTASNLESWSIENTLDELFVSVTYADRPEANAFGFVVAKGGSWQGEFQLQISDEPAGTVDASATLERSGQPVHATDGETGMRNHLQVTPYHFTLTIEGPGDSASLDCTLYEVREMLHQPNPSG
jgi:hypothetical protein